MKTASQGILNFCWQSLIFLQILSTYAMLERASGQNRPEFSYFKFLNQTFFLIFRQQLYMDIYHKLLYANRDFCLR